MSDLISRQAAIDALGDMVMNWTDSDYELGQLNQWKEDRKAIIDLPSAQPQITLESAIDFLHEIGWMQEHDRILTESGMLLERMNGLPSAQPQRMKAKWECKGKPNSGKNVEWVCTHCGFSVWAEFCNYKYCNNCGYYMCGKK